MCPCMPEKELDNHMTHSRTVINARIRFRSKGTFPMPSIMDLDGEAKIARGIPETSHEYILKR